MDSLHTYEPEWKDLLGEFEARKEEEHKRAMREEIGAEIKRRDDKMFAEASRTCPECEGSLHSHGRTGSMGYLAACGKISVRLKRLRCISCGHIVVPAVSLIPKNGISAALAERMCDLASKMPYAKAAGSMAIQHGIAMSTKRFWTCVQEEAEKIEDVLATEAEELYCNGVVPESADLSGERPLIIGIDGGFVRGWKKEPGFEVKCATVATGSAPGPGKQRHLTDRVGYAAVCSIDDFRKRVSVLAIKSGYLSASARIFVTDGAPWIVKMVADWFPDAIHVLDLFHLKQKVTQLFGVSAEGVDAAVRDRALKACDAYDPKRILGIIGSWVPPDSSKEKQLEDLAAYIANNAQAIKNHKLVRIHGSGWIEKGVDLMVSRRMKNRGMSWTKNGSSHIVPFAVLRYNKQWGVYWNKRKGLSRAEAA